VTRRSLALGVLLASVARASPDAGAELDAISTPGVLGEVLASQLMGVDDLEPIRPGTLGEVVSAIGAFSRSGVLVPGVAAELTPWALGLGLVTTHARYVEDGALRLLARSSLSLATASDPQADGGVRGAVALRFRFRDDSDWRLNEEAIACARQAYGANPAPPSVPPSDGVVLLPEVSPETLRQVRRCSDDHVRWNATQLAGGLALPVAVPAGDLTRTRADALQALLSAAVGVGQHLQLLGTARYAFHFSHAASALDPAIEDRHLGGLGGRVVLKLESFVANVNLAAGVERLPSSWAFRGLIGVALQLRLNDALWIGTAVNASIDGRGPPSALTFGSSLTWSQDTRQPL
jgi:hypothetical protein